MTVTYEKIATTTLGSNTNTVTFSSISGSYTDLRLVETSRLTGAAHSNMRFNSDTGSNYSGTNLSGNGTSASSGRGTNTTALFYGSTDGQGAVNNYTQVIWDVMNYSNTTTYKTALVRASQALTESTTAVGLWRNTAAITSITLFPTNSKDFITGSTFTIYGIKAE